MMDEQDDDIRSTELESLKAIFPEIRHPNAEDGFTFEIELPVVPAAPVKVTFPLPSGANNDDVAPHPHQARGLEPPAEDSLHITHLPSLLLLVCLPQGYPSESPPVVQLTTSPSWLPAERLEYLRAEAHRLWAEAGRDLMVYTYIDHVQRAAENVFDAINADGSLEMDPRHKLAVLDYDIKAKRAAFEKETFDCGVCLEPKKGLKCHKMLDCGHIFCLECLQAFYNDAIQEGSISSVRCLAPNCAKTRSAATVPVQSGSKPRNHKVFISPSELLQIGLEEDTVKRFVSLKYKTELETDKNTVYCPRPACNGAARSKRHRKPMGLEISHESDVNSDSDEEDEVNKADGPADDSKAAKRNHKPYDPADQLAVCEDCSFAFCRRCFRPWHGEFVYCQPKTKNGDITAEEKASLEYLHLHTSPCPTCNAPAQKTHGCNHMICSRCDTHFCYLCSAWLDPTNPYRHYNTQPNGKVTSCYMRLWELEGGDGDDVGLGFAGGLIRRLDQAQPDPVEDMVEPVQLEERAAPEPDDGAQDEARQPLNLRAPAVAREAPLVLRIVDQQPRPAARPAAPGPPPVRGRGRGRGRGQGAPRGAGGRGQPVNRQVVQQARGQPRAARGGAAAIRQARDPRPLIGLPDIAGDPAADLDPAQEQWVRRFVQMALMDAEDELDGDSDDENENFRIQ